jgi:hypothetical protein
LIGAVNFLQTPANGIVKSFVLFCFFLTPGYSDVHSLAKYSGAPLQGLRVSWLLRDSSRNPDMSAEATAWPTTLKLAAYH